MKKKPIKPLSFYKKLKPETVVSGNLTKPIDRKCQRNVWILLKNLHKTQQLSLLINYYCFLSIKIIILSQI